MLVGSFGFANNNNIKSKKVVVIVENKEVLAATCSAYTNAGDRIILTCRTCSTVAQCREKIKKLLAIQ